MTCRWAAVLSGNRNFEGRISPDVNDELPGLPAAGDRLRHRGHHGLRLRDRPARADTDGNDVFLKDIWPSYADQDHRLLDQPREMFTDSYADVVSGRRALALAAHPETTPSSGTTRSTYVPGPRYFDGMPAEPEPVSDIKGSQSPCAVG